MQIFYQRVRQKSLANLAWTFGFACLILIHCFFIADVSRSEDSSLPISTATSSSSPSALSTNEFFRIEVKKEGQQSEFSLGRVLAMGEDGGCLLQESNGRLQVVVASESGSIESQGQPFVPMSIDEASENLLAELPKGFKSFSTKHYVIGYNTTEAYAKWNGSMYEKLFRAFYNYWKRYDVDLKEPEFPLIAVVFASRDDYLRYAENEKVVGAESMIGYYSMLSNRIVSYDLTGIEGMIPAGQRVTSSELINAILSQPIAERSVATVVHEAVHQLAYNSGLQRRLADNPLSISEGIAMYFESPDLSNASGWSGIGKINRHNLPIFQQYVNQRPADSILSLVSEDDRFRNLNSVTAAYAESWALVYFLMKTKPKEFGQYLTELALHPPLGESDARQRMNDFQKHLGKDLQKLDRDFLKYMSRQ